MKILLCAAEVSPFAKVGGLADVSGSLSKSLKELGHDVRVITPCYGLIDKNKYHLEDVINSKINIKFGNKEVIVSLKQTKVPMRSGSDKDGNDKFSSSSLIPMRSGSDMVVYFIDNYEYFGAHSEIYPRKDARFEHERFIIFGLATLKLMEKINFKPDVIHCNDWHTANIPVYLKASKEYSPFYSETALIYTIHNLAYQGRYSKDILEFANLDPEKVFTQESLEFYNDINWMKGGIIYSDQINTVSKEYAKEIQTPEYGENLDQLLRANNHKLTGIINGIDYDAWNPTSDPEIPENYTSSDLSGKNACKIALQKELGLTQNPNIPLIGLVSRLVKHKGIDLIIENEADIKKMNLQLVVLGTGEDKYEKFFKDFATTAKNVESHIGFNAKLAKKIYAGSDLFLMPSRFEPCGLGQLISLRYGTIPIVRKTGGLSDTVIDYDRDRKKGLGFVFDEYDAEKLLITINRALQTFENKTKWKSLVNNAMNHDYSWNKSAHEYLKLYEKAIITHKEGGN